MIIGDLSSLADQLRREGFEARNLGQVGITIWRDGAGFFLSAEELRELPHHFTPRDFREVLEHRGTDGNS
jgi:hypothetical protein